VKWSFEKPVVSKCEEENVVRSLAGRFAGDHRVTFAVGSYDRSELLFSTPVLNYFALHPGSSMAWLRIGWELQEMRSCRSNTLTDFLPERTGCRPAARANSGARRRRTEPCGNATASTPRICRTTYNPGHAFAVQSILQENLYTGTTSDEFSDDGKWAQSRASASQSNGHAFLTETGPTLSGTSSLLYSTYLAGREETSQRQSRRWGSNAYMEVTDSVDFPTKKSLSQNVQAMRLELRFCRE